MTAPLCGQSYSFTSVFRRPITVPGGGVGGGGGGGVGVGVGGGVCERVLGQAI